MEKNNICDKMKEVKRWVEKAVKDLSDAEFNLSGKRFEVAAFLSHQAAEKALKALYILRFKRLWKTHDLVGILTEVKGNKALLKLCEDLNRHYIETRYPTETEYTEKIASDAIKKARKVVEWVKGKIGK